MTVRGDGRRPGAEVRGPTSDVRGPGAGIVYQVSLLLLLAGAFAGCGKKGAPLAPLNLAPAAPQAVTARRLGDTVYLQMTVPDKNVSGRGEYSVDHVDVYAVTIPPGTAAPVTREFLQPRYVVARISIQPPPDPDAAEPEKPDPRPKPGDTITFTETLTAAALAPTALVVSKEAAKAAKAAEAAKAAAAKAVKKNGAETAATPPAAPPGPAVLTRYYMLMGVPKKGRGSAPSTPLEVPLLQPPPPPSPGAPSANESSVTLTWQPPPSSSDEVPGVFYNVYAAPAPGAAPAAAAPTQYPAAPAPLNDQPLADTTFTHAGAQTDKEQCFVVRSVARVGSAVIESDPSSTICITPKDTFPPAAPKGLAAVASTAVVNLIWDANTEADLAGYIVLRGEAGDATLQPLTAEPIKETRYTDRTARPGTRYAYEIVAVDKTGNRSAPSNRVEEAAR